MKISLAGSLAKLPLPATEKWPQGVWDVTALKHGTMSLLLFAPKNRDYQTSHLQDELYVILRGEGTLILEGERIGFETGDVLFVPAGRDHRFVEFSDDLTTWAVFWGPAHGESP